LAGLIFTAHFKVSSGQLKASSYMQELTVPSNYKKKPENQTKTKKVEKLICS